MANIVLTEAPVLDHFTAEHDQETPGANYKLTLWWVAWAGHDKIVTFTEHTFTTAEPPLNFWTNEAPADMATAYNAAGYDLPPT